MVGDRIDHRRRAGVDAGYEGGAVSRRPRQAPAAPNLGATAACRSLQHLGAVRRHHISQDVCRELTIHAGIEEQSFYPEIRKINTLEDMVLESIEEHHVLKQLVAEIEGLPADDEHLEPKMTVLKENVTHHV